VVFEERRICKQRKKERRKGVSNKRTQHVYKYRNTIYGKLVCNKISVYIVLLVKVKPNFLLLCYRGNVGYMGINYS
jgi:hypothetical protein